MEVLVPRTANIGASMRKELSIPTITSTSAPNPGNDQRSHQPQPDGQHRANHLGPKRPHRPLQNLGKFLIRYQIVDFAFYERKHLVMFYVIMCLDVVLWLLRPVLPFQALLILGNPAIFFTHFMHCLFWVIWLVFYPFHALLVLGNLQMM